MTSLLRQYDTRDDRQTVHKLLTRLHPRRRLAFLAWCCSQATMPNTALHPQVARKTLALLPAAERDDEADRRLALECVFDLAHLTAQYQLDLTAALLRLESLVRRQR